jgi:RHS repeat-associated protein
LSVDGISLLDVQSWHGNASPKTVFIGNGVITLANAYDARPRLLGSRYTRATDGAMLADLRYRYDAADNLTARQFVHRGGRADFFAYDDGERVDTAHIGARPFATGVAARTEGPYAPTEGGFGPGYYARDFNYDSSGLDYLTTVSLTKPASVRAAPFASNWGGHDAFLHATTVDGFNRGAPDPLGNVTTTPLQIRLPNAAGSSPVGGRLTYNGLSMLTRIERTDGVVIENSYQHNGLRHFRKVSPPAGAALESAYIYDEGRLIEEYQDAGSGQQLVGRYYYAHDDAPVAADLRHPVTGLLQRYHYLRDNTLSIVGVADAAGQVVERVVYDAFGQPLIETADDTPPTIANVIAGAGGSWLVVLSESVLVPLGNLAAGPDLVTASGSLANSISVRDNVTGLPLAGSALLEEAAAGFDFARVLRFTPTQVPTGSVSLTIPADSVADEWGNLNPAVTVIFTPGGAPGTVLFQAAGVGDTGPRQVARSAVGNPFLFQGQYFDYDAGLVYMRARFYDPFAGQYLQPDPLGYEDSVNLYAGLGNNPTSFRDPTGTANIRITVNRPRGNLVPLSSRVPKGGRTRPDPSEGTPAVTSWTRPERAPRPREASIQVDEAQLHSGGRRSPHAGAELQRDVTQPGVPPPAARRSAGASSGTGPARYALQTEEGIRPVVVVQTSRGPQAFYRSTGGNSGLPNQWLPFEGIDYKLGYIGDFGSFNQGFFQSVGSLMLNKGGFATGRRRGDSLRRFGDPEIVPEEFSRELRSISQRLSRSTALNNLQNYKLLEGAGADGLEQAARVINQHLFDRGARVRPDFDYYFFNALPRGAD